MSAIYVMIHDTHSDFRTIRPYGRILHDGLTSYGLGGASEPCEAETSFESGECRIIMGSIQNNAHAGVPATSCVVETGQHLAVCDAMIYNRKSFPGQDMLSDGELLVRTYEREGLSGLRSLSGDFAAVLIDKENGRIFLIRDHMGIRPLYTMQSKHYVTICTDYRPFFRLPENQITINEERLYEYLTMGIVASRTETLFANILKSEAGAVTRMTPNGKIIASDIYWTPGMRKVPEDKWDVQYEKIYAKLIRDAVRNRVDAVGGEAIGAEFSGGLDSGIIVSLLDEYAQETGHELPLLATWSPSEEEYPIREQRNEVIRDEREVIKKFCEDKGNSCVYRPRCDAEDPEVYLKNTERKDICEFDADIIMYTMKALSGRGIRTVFSGWGGDEAATMRFGPSGLLESGELRAFLHEASYAAGKNPKKYLGFIKRALTAVRDSHAQWDGRAANGWQFNIAKDEYAHRILGKREKKYNYFGWNPVENLLTGGMESRTAIAAASGADMGMVYMFPMLDPLLIDYALNVPRRLYMKDGRRRLLPQKALEDIVPGYLTKFSGESNVEKLDTGRMDFYYEVAEETQSRTDEIILARLDRELFAEYVDFDAIERNLLHADNTVERNVLRSIMRTLYKMQLLLNECR
jgi:asparagine synthase (glutamine-hydrolysing)